MDSSSQDPPWQKAEPLAWQFVKDEAVVLDMDRNVLRGLNASAWFIWDLIDGQRGAQGIADRLAAHFQIPLDQARRDVEAFLGQLEQRSLARKVS